MHILVIISKFGNYVRQIILTYKCIAVFGSQVSFGRINEATNQQCRARVYTCIDNIVSAVFDYMFVEVDRLG